MADPLLTSLCAICHISPPQYKCPRCSIRTCSMPCIKKHKAWSSCSGERDQSAYMPPSRLRTAAGIDHDYNFLHGIEMGIERAEKVVIGDKGLVKEDEIRPMTMQEVRWKMGKDGTRRKVVITRLLRDDDRKGLKPTDRAMGHCLRKLNTVVDNLPIGMARQRESRTTFNKRGGRMNWQVEWLTFDTEASNGDQDEGSSTRTRRWLCKAMDNIPLYRAYEDAMDDQAKALNPSSKRPHRTIRYEAAQNLSSRWQDSSSAVQDPKTGTWFRHERSCVDTWPSNQEDTNARKFQYFLGRPLQKSGEPVTVTRVKAVDCLRDILSNTRVLEFPTIYILRPRESLPHDFVEGAKATVPPVSFQHGGKRERNHHDQGPAAKRSKGNGGGRQLEDGEVASGDEEDDSASKRGVKSKERDWDDSGSKGTLESLEAGEIIDEQSFEEDEGDEDDETSSSGTDSESEEDS